MKSRVLRLEHIFNIWPVLGANVSVLRVSAPDYEYFVEQLQPGLRRPVFMRAPVECAPELPAGTGIIGFDTGHVRSVSIEWSEL